MGRSIHSRVAKLEQQRAPKRLRPIELIQGIQDGTLSDEDIEPWNAELEQIVAGAALAEVDK
jgi:hypothetical protein